MRYQVYWSKYPFQFNIKICFRPGWLKTKPGVLIHRRDIYPEQNIIQLGSGSQNYKAIFDQTKLFLSDKVDQLPLLLSISDIVIDQLTLYNNIRTALLQNGPMLENMDISLLDSSLTRKRDVDRLLCIEDKIFISNIRDLCLHILRNYHNYILVGYPGQAKTL